MTKPQSNIITHLKIMQIHYAVILFQYYRLILLFIVIFIRYECEQCIKHCDVCNTDDDCLQ